MIDIRYTTEVAKCPSCGQNIQVSVGKVPGGINDSGGWILKCDNCHELLPYDVRNPFDYSSVDKGAQIIDKWDKDVPDDKKEMLAKYGLEKFTDDHHIDKALFVQTGQYEKVTFKEKEDNIFYCPICRNRAEEKIYADLRTKMVGVNKAIESYLPFYYKGRAGHPDSIILADEYICSCGFSTKAIFYKQFKEAELPIQNEHELILIDLLGSALDITVDGIYERESCLVILEKLLIRWQVFYNQVLIAVPFIGLDYKGREQERVDLWNWVLKTTLPHKTTLLTRKATLTKFLSATESTGMDARILQDYGMLNRTLDEMMTKGALFKTEFHAKFFAGFNKDTAEVLAGSFNIHRGRYVENIHFKLYQATDFFEKYITPMSLRFDSSNMDDAGDMLFIQNTSEDNSYKASLEKYITSRKDKIYEMVGH